MRLPWLPPDRLEDAYDDVERRPPPGGSMGRGSFGGGPLGETGLVDELLVDAREPDPLRAESVDVVAGLDVPERWERKEDATLS